MDLMLWIWLGVIIVAVVVEALTTQLVCIWFAVGGVAALIAKAFGANEIVQIVIAAAVTLILVICTRPLVKKYLKNKKVSTNSDRYIGETGTVVERIDGTAGTGQVKVGTSLWSARSEGEAIPENTQVKVLRIEGVKLIVEKV